MFWITLKNIARYARAGVDRITVAAVEDYGVDRCCQSYVKTFAQAGIVPRQRGVWRSRNHKAVSGR